MGRIKIVNSEASATIIMSAWSNAQSDEIIRWSVGTDEFILDVPDGQYPKVTAWDSATGAAVTPNVTFENLTDHRQASPDAQDI